MTKLDEIIEGSWIRNSYNDVAFDKHSFATALIEAIKGEIKDHCEIWGLPQVNDEVTYQIDLAFENLKKEG